MMVEKKRCHWLNDDPVYIKYHDEEWGVPIHDEKKLFEFLILEGAQAGLSWITVLKRREGYRKCFDNFDAKKISQYNDAKKAALLADERIIRNRLKVDAAIQNAKSYLAIKKEMGSFSDYLWSFVNGKPICNDLKSGTSIPATSPESDAMSKDLKKRGFKFVGSTICYAFMQAVGMVNDHPVTCFRHKQVKKLK